MAMITPQPPQDVQMLVNQGQQARELQAFAQHPSLPVQPVAALPLEAQTDQGQQMRWRVVCISVVLAVYLVINALLQYIFDMAAMTDLLEKVREVTHMRGGPSATSFLLHGVPSVFMGIMIGLLVPLCGYLGVRQSQKWLLGCFCGCNAFHCCSGIISMVMIIFLTMTIKAATPQVELFLKTCDPMQCRHDIRLAENDHLGAHHLGPPPSLNHHEDESMLTSMLVNKSIDCLATGEWNEYKPRFSGPYLPVECPPIFLKCGSDYQARAPGQEYSTEYHSSRQHDPSSQYNYYPVGGGLTTTNIPPRGSRIERWTTNGPSQRQPMPGAVFAQGAFDDADAPVRAAGMGDYGAFLSSEVPHHVHQGLRRLSFAFGKAHQKGKAMFLQSHKPAFAEPPMPQDPITQCSVDSNTVKQFHQIRLLAPQLLPQLEIFLLLRMVLLLPLVVLGCLGFCWGKDLYERVDQGYNPVASSQHAQPQVMLNPALGISVAPQMSMAQPLMLSAPPVPPPQVTAITPPS